MNGHWVRFSRVPEIALFVCLFGWLFFGDCHKVINHSFLFLIILKPRKSKIMVLVDCSLRLWVLRDTAFMYWRKMLVSSHLMIAPISSIMVPLLSSNSLSNVLLLVYGR